ncbi:NAD(P)/FAD-dependent oxidoreductase [Teichococcus cervicalis]|uniref:FAD dependent oxidoreductase n=1 Tax=Pseudoroseomonas cervicalis ATCC 49957 TaxID=525371 RepID=D5RK03_9PROT|nr:FAD-binding oxidoreductase [Pseudoroseomonas cervicalis]EFH12365.1 FAD dependent oxidoreductase [Pseudoroseomonas cervicalis ATCC 49957]
MTAPLPPSLYAETAIPAHPAPPLSGEQRVPVAIIGGGFTGLSTALHLAERGILATLIEAAEPGWGASGRNGGQVNPGLKPDPNQVVAEHGEELGGRMLALSYGAPDRVFEIIRRHQITCEARQNGTLRAALRPANARAVAATAEQCARRGMPVEFLDARATTALLGTPLYAGAMLDRRGGDVNPLSYARGLARAAAQLGARIHGGTPALSLTREGALWRVTTPGGALLAEQVVLATNGYTGDLWPGLRQSVAPVFSSIASSEALPEEVARQVLPLRGSVYESGRITVYYRIDQGNRLLMGGRGPQAPIQGPEAIRYLIAYAERLWPVLRGRRWSHGWNGQLAMTADHYPHLHEPAPGLLAALGYNGRGVAMATAMGHELARRLAGAAPEAIDMPFSPVRPMPFHGFWKLGVAATVWKGRVLDAMGI